MEDSGAVPRLMITGDGSHTVYRDDLGEPYHSVYGALQESMHVFIEAGFRNAGRKEIFVLEVGFGTGLNALLTCLESARYGILTHYSGIEPFPLPASVSDCLNYPELLKEPESAEVLKRLHKATSPRPAAITDLFDFTRIGTGIEETPLEPSLFDLVYFDAFAPEVQPELWTGDVFQRTGKSLKPGGILVTYCCKGSVQRALKTSGFSIEKLPGPPGKREMLRATKI